MLNPLTPRTTRNKTINELIDEAFKGNNQYNTVKEGVVTKIIRVDDTVELEPILLDKEIKTLPKK